MAFAAAGGMSPPEGSRVADVSAVVANHRRTGNFLQAYAAPEQIRLSDKQAFGMGQACNSVTLVLELAVQLPMGKQDLRDVSNENVSVADTALSPISPAVARVV